MEFSPDGPTLIIAGTEVILWNLDTHRKIGAFTEQRQSVNRSFFSPDGNFLVSGDLVAAISGYGRLLHFP